MLLKELSPQKIYAAIMQTWSTPSSCYLKTQKNLPDEVKEISKSTLDFQVKANEKGVYISTFAAAYF